LTTDIGSVMAERKEKIDLEIEQKKKLKVLKQ
jgi:hypothetical protein